MLQYQIQQNKILLPGKHRLVQQIIKNYYNKSHSGTECILSELRQVYWILISRTAFKAIGKQFLHCRKMKSKLVTPYMVDLSNVRLDYKHLPFINTAVDYFGPIFIKQHRSRLKRWGCLFVCMVTTAIHIELVESKDTDSFINALQRFISRRGKPNTIVSEFGSNFRGAVKEMKLEHSSFNQMKIAESTERYHIVWKFNPPSSPHMGGSWERLMHLVKTSLFKIVKERILTNFQMITIFTRVDKMVNNRPITADSDSADDLEALTQNHFLIGRNSNDRSYLGKIIKEDMCSRKRRRLKEYLTILTKRVK